jgi:2-oxoglutarate/2-oxoacid ferredoxin oxidoreductase subunit alpha
MNNQNNKFAWRNFSWRIGGAQGRGIDRLTTVFGRLCAGQGLHIYSRREYHSNIIGRHSYADICLGSKVVTSHSDAPDMLLTLDAESLARHVRTLNEQGVLIFDDGDAQASLDALPFLDERLKTDLLRNLSSDDLPGTTAGLLEQARALGVQLVPLPYRSLIDELAEEFGLSRKQASRSINTIAVAASAALLSFGEQDLNHALENVFGSAHPALALNQRAVNKTYRLIDKQYTPLEHVGWLQDQSIDRSRLYLNGCQSVAMGKLAAGLTFQTYYPISPASDESQFLEANTANTDGSFAPLILQVEDEISAATMACGAALTGARSATATSGPGFCLMTEALGWAGMNEVPLVISLYQRGGPSTGLPTRTEQGDLGFAVHAGHGEFPRMVMASGDIEDCFYDAMQAFNYAERYQLPVIHMLDRALASCSQTVERFDYRDINIDRGMLFEVREKKFGQVERFVNTATGISPRPLLGQDQATYWSTGVEHDSYGQVSEDPQVREQMMEKRQRKLQQVLQELSFDEKLRVCGDEQAEFIVLTWGSSKGAVWDAVARLDQSGIKLRAIQVKLLWPFPEQEILSLIKPEHTLIVVECNYCGQLNNLLREVTGRCADHCIVKYNGRAMSGESVAESVLKIVSTQTGEREPRMVLHNDYE